jgi:hypothetical protein
MTGLLRALGSGLLRGSLLLLFAAWWLFLGPLASWLGIGDSAKTPPTAVIEADRAAPAVESTSTARADRPASR